MAAAELLVAEVLVTPRVVSLLFVLRSASAMSASKSIIKFPIPTSHSLSSSKLASDVRLVLPALRPLGPLSDPPTSFICKSHSHSSSTVEHPPR